MSQLTRIAIISSFLSLLNERPLDKITIKDIVERCGINRKTFYYHFQDIYDLLRCVFAEELNKLRATISPDESTQECVFRIAAFILENRRAVLHIYRSVNRDELEKFLFDSALEPIGEVVRKKAEGVVHTEEDLDFLCRLYASGFTGLILLWLKDGMNATPEAVIKKLCALLEGSVPFALENLHRES